MAYANPAGIIDMFHVVGEDYPPKDRHSDRFSVVVRLIYKKDGSRDNGRYDFELKQWQYFTYDGSSKAIAESRIILWCGYSVSLPIEWDAAFFKTIKQFRQSSYFVK